MSHKDTVVLFDVENIAETDELKKILGLIYDSILNDVSPYMSVAYADWSRQSLGEKRLLLLAYGVVPQQVISYGGRVQKNAADIALCVDAVEMLMDPDIKRFVLVTGDGGFVSLVSKLKKHKREVIVVSTSRGLSSSISSFADEVYTPQGIVRKHEHTDPNTEVNKPYFKALWAISKSYSDIKDVFKTMFSKASVVDHINVTGLDYDVIESILKSAKFHPNQIKKALVVSLKNKSKFVLAKVDSKIVVIGAGHESISRAEILNNIDNGNFVYKQPISELFSKEYVIGELASQGIEISKSGITGEILDYIIGNYTHFKALDIDLIADDIAVATKRRRSLIIGALKLMILLKINQTISAKNTRIAVCSRLVKYLAKADYARQMYDVVWRDVFKWE